MSVPSTDFQTTYTTDGVTTTYPFSWRVVELDSVQVYLNNVLQSPALYTPLKNVVGLGGTVNFLVAPAAGQTLLIQRVSDTLQLDSLQNQASLPPATLIDMFDKLTIIGQQVTAQIALSLSLSLTLAESGVSAILPPPIPGGIFAWAADGKSVVYIDPASGAVGTVITNAGVNAVPVYAAGGGGGGGGGDVSFVETGGNPAFNSGICFFNDTTGLNITAGTHHGPAGTVFTSIGPTSTPTWDFPVSALLKASSVPLTANQLPTTGHWAAGIYQQGGVWIQTGNITYDSNVRIYHNGALLDFIGGFTVTPAYLPQTFGSNQGTAAIAASNGYGLGGGQNVVNFAANASGGGGGSNGALGGLGGSNVAGQTNTPGNIYNYLQFFGGSGGSGGNGNTSTPGGVGGPGIYIESTGTISCSGAMGVPTIDASGQSAASTATSGGGGGGGSGGTIVIRAAAIANGNGTNDFQANGGDGGTVSGGGGGAGGGGGQVDIAVSGATATCAAAVLGGTHGTGSGTVVAQPGSPGVTRIATSQLLISVF